jgi:hypothetical protein
MVFKRGQVTIFIILGILIVGTIAVFFALKSSPVEDKIPSDIAPIYIYFLSCLEEETMNGINLLEFNGGYIRMPPFEAGSSYMPFSSQLNFLGNPIPYWYYVSGNNIPKEQVPSIAYMENELAEFVDGKIRNCNFDNYYSAGFEITQGVPKSNVKIRDGKVLVNLKMPMNITHTNESFLINSHSIEFPSNLKKLYDSAVNLYNKEQTEMFLENYTVDFLRNYAPVDGIELSCSPLVWNIEDVFSTLHHAIESNILALKTKGGDFTLTKKENKYFIINTDIDARFITSRNWSYSFEVNPSKGALLISEPMGNQEGFGILGFCFVNYHFVYDIKYPVLIQVYEEEEFFQFPVAVVLKGNVPREPMKGTFFEPVEISKFCEYKNTPVAIHVNDKSGNPVEATVSYGCSTTSCDIGNTSNGSMTELFPQCVNGNLVINSPGFRELSFTYTIMNEEEISLFLERAYEKEVNLKLDSREYSGEAIINFVSDAGTETIFYPLQKKINLSQGQYEIQVYIYKDSSLVIPESNQEECIDVPKSGIGSLLGLTEEKCFGYTLPSQIVSNALSGGGKENYYILEEELENSNAMNINAYSLPKPTSLEQLQTNYILFEEKGLDVLFK